ncbi:GDYXXLXY domain-containing protein [Alkalicoccus halolimnae]|uniref:GDYXXLXY domain-containing protein n=1 Tax=Alkalicoccus halolimnae TaxID=1667239 RepID=A0A5C7F4Z4_9BACI|nr:GDYXXLXY domain-containing protein [Alkalicoccus halolimnae]TXF85143.1 GDYXXLXY domain-containing protein [Alkalicoccus halolimnae]
MIKWLFPIFQTVFIILLVTGYHAISWSGDQYLLRAEPYDPFDPFYGEYVMLQYPDLEPPSDIKEGPVYFTLTEGSDGFAVLNEVKEEPFFGSISGSLFGEYVTAPQLEQYYVEQGSGPELEEAVDLQVTVDVAPWGAIRPVNLEVREE